MLKITFFIRATRDSNNSYCLYCRITYKKTKKEFSLKEKFQKNQWNQSRQKLVGNSPQADFVTNLLSTTKYDLMKFSIKGNFNSANDLYADFLRSNKPLPTLLSIVDNYIDKNQKRIKHGTLLHHKAKKRNLILFEKESEITYYSNSFTSSVGMQFVEWFKETKQTNNIGTASRNVLFYKNALDFAVKYGIIESHSLSNYAGSKDLKKSNVFLNPIELAIIEVRQFQNELISRVKDLFLFQCYTGLSYGDLWSNFKLEKLNEVQILRGTRTKNKSQFIVPLSNRCLSILEKYDFSFTRLCNQNYNRSLKLIAARCGIEKNLTTHVGRKTFATLKDAEGWSRESVSKMLGHKSIKTTEHYYIGESTLRIENEIIKRLA